MAGYSGRAERDAVRGDWRLWVRVAALGVLLLSFLAPEVVVQRRVHDVVMVLDITGSMNVRDQTLDGVAVSRIAAEKRAVRRVLGALPCGSRLGLGVFVAGQPFLLFEPVEVCANFAAVDGEISAVDWRMGWDSESHIAESLLEAMRMAAGLRADLVFMTDGQETPPLAWSGAPEFSRVRGTVRGVVVGVGGYGFSPIPRFDPNGREIGVFRPGDVPSETGGMFRGREHLSAVDETHLKSLAAQGGLEYAHLEGAGVVLPGAIRGVEVRMGTGWVAGVMAFGLLVGAQAKGRPSFLKKRSKKLFSVRSV